MKGVPALLVIAGHDPSSGPSGYAGLRADAEAAADAALHRRRGGAPLRVRKVVTAWTDQNQDGVRSLGAREPTEWLEEARSEAEQAQGAGGLGAIKTGLLPSAAHVRALVDLLRPLRLGNPRLPVVVDPVLNSSSGAEFLDSLGQAVLLSELLPLGVILTPNLPEAATLAAFDPRPESTDRSRPIRLRQARTLLARGARAVVLKGGHGGEDPLLNLVATASGGITWLGHPRQPGTLRGTGCRFASALAAGLALELPLTQAATLAAARVAARFARPTPEPPPSPGSQSGI